VAGLFLAGNVIHPLPVRFDSRVNIAQVENYSLAVFNRASKLNDCLSIVQNHPNRHFLKIEVVDYLVLMKCGSCLEQLRGSGIPLPFPPRFGLEG
jgi:hypothetical protein